MSDRELDLPTAADADRYLDALDVGERRAVEGVANGGRQTLDAHPVLAAAVVAESSRRVQRYRRLAIASGGGLATLAVVVSLLQSLPWLLLAAPVIGAAGSGRAGVRWALASRSRDRHAEVLRSHGSVPGPGPVDAPDLAQDAAEDRTRARIVAGAGMALLSVWVLTIWWQDQQLGDALRDRGVTTSATVQDVDRNRRGPDRWEVAHDTEDGSTVTTDVFAVGRAADGDQVTIVHLPDDPGAARAEGGLDGRWYYSWFVGGIWVVLLPVAALGIRRDRDLSDG